MKKFVVIFLLFVLSICCVGCNPDEKSITNTISDDLTKAQLCLVDLNYQDDYTLNSNIFVNENSDNSWFQQIDVFNDQLDYMISYFNSKSNSVESLCKIVKQEKLDISKRQEIILKDLCSSVVLNAENMQKLQDKINTKIAKLQNTNIVNSTQIRNLYINNMCNNIDNIYNILYQITNLNQEIESQKTSWHNVDSYKKNKENKTNDTNQYEANYPNNYNGYGYNYYGRGMTNPFYYGGYGGFGLYGGGMFPFGRNPYMPNIDTFGVYKNIDTYKPIEIKQVNEEEE